MKDIEKYFLKISTIIEIYNKLKERNQINNIKLFLKENNISYLDIEEMILYLKVELKKIEKEEELFLFNKTFKETLSITAKKPDELILAPEIINDMKRLTNLTKNKRSLINLDKLIEDNLSFIIIALKYEYKYSITELINLRDNVDIWRDIKLS